MNVSEPHLNVSAVPTTSAEPIAVNLENLGKHFGRFAALRSVTAEFRAGQMYAFLGDNGAGKTTLLRTIAGLSPPSHGAVTVLGATDLRSVTGQIGYMAHPSLLYDEMSGLENLRYFAALYGICDDRACESAIAAVGLDPVLTRRVDQYSQGMRQRLSLARAIVHHPKILLLDEPFSNVDLVSAREIVGLLAKMRAEGKTIFIVTHQVALLEHVADEFVWMAAGQISRRTRELGFSASRELSAPAAESKGRVT